MFFVSLVVYRIRLGVVAWFRAPTSTARNIGDLTKCCVPIVTSHWARINRKAVMWNEAPWKRSRTTFGKTVFFSLELVAFEVFAILLLFFPLNIHGVARALGRQRQQTQRKRKRYVSPHSVHFIQCSHRFLSAANILLMPFQMCLFRAINSYAFAYAFLAGVCVCVCVGY